MHSLQILVCRVPSIRQHVLRGRGARGGEDPIQVSLASPLRLVQISNPHSFQVQAYEAENTRANV